MAGRPQLRDPARLFAAAAEPMYFVDAQRRLAFVNPACAALAGHEAGELAGLECRYHSDPSVAGPEAQAALLAPPPEAFDGTVVSADVSWPASGGQPVRRFRAAYARLSLAAGQPAGLLVILRPLAGDAPPSTPAAEGSLLHDRLRHFRSLLTRQYDAERLLGDHPAMERVRQQVRLAARGEAHVTIVGTPGSGRKHVARAIHYRGPSAPGMPAAAGSLALLEASGLTAELLSSTLRTLTLGDARRTAAPATLLLAEVERLPADAQAELSAAMARKPPLRIFSTAQTALSELSREGRFRADLACQLGTLVIELPRLAARSADIPLLAQMFLEEANATGTKQLSGFTPEALDLLTGYPWPGEIAELADLVRQAHARASGPQVRPGDLPERIALAREAALYPPKAEESIDLEALLGRIEKDVITQALARARGRKARAARLLGLTRAKLLRRMTQLGFEMEIEEREPIEAADAGEVEFEPDDGMN